jgi:hypothetical protein
MQAHGRSVYNKPTWKNGVLGWVLKRQFLATSLPTVVAYTALVFCWQVQFWNFWAQAAWLRSYNDTAFASLKKYRLAIFQFNLRLNRTERGVLCKNWCKV